MASRDYYEGLDQPVGVEDWCLGMIILGFLLLIVASPFIAVVALYTAIF